MILAFDPWFVYTMQTVLICLAIYIYSISNK